MKAGDTIRITEDECGAPVGTEVVVTAVTREDFARVQVQYFVGVVLYRWKSSETADEFEEWMATADKFELVKEL